MSRLTLTCTELHISQSLPVKSHHYLLSRYKLVYSTSVGVLPHLSITALTMSIHHFDGGDAGLLIQQQIT